MSYIFFFLSEIVLLFFLSRKLTANISLLLLKVFNNKKVAVYFFSFLFLPGTFIHEMSHFIAAKVLFVPVGKFNLKPVMDTNTITMGSVSIAKTDLFRQTIIGTAPFLVGLLIIILPFWVTSFNKINVNGLLTNLFILYVIFQVGNTMFLSRSDLRGFIRLMILILLIFIVLQLFNININVFGQWNLVNVQLTDVIKRASVFLIIPIFLDVILLAAISIINETFT